MSAPNTLDLGNGHRIEFTRDGQGDFGGLIHYHRRPNGKACAGAVTFRGRGRDGGPEWDVISLDPLTLSPSLYCRACGSHGFIRNGEWIEADSQQASISASPPATPRGVPADLDEPEPAETQEEAALREMWQARPPELSEATVAALKRACPPLEKE